MSEHDIYFTLNDSSPFSPDEDTRVLVDFLRGRTESPPRELLKIEEIVARAKNTPVEERAPETQGPNEPIIPDPFKEVDLFLQNTPTAHRIHGSVIIPGQDQATPLDNETVDFLKGKAIQTAITVDTYVDEKAKQAALLVRGIIQTESNIAEIHRGGRKPIDMDVFHSR